MPPVPPSAAPLARRSLSAALLVLALPLGLPAQDAEQATHADTASTPQVAFEDRGPRHLLRQYQLGCLSHLSYLLVADGEAAVIDPQRDVDVYLADAGKLGAKLKYVLLTHPHADFVAGHTELAARSGATIAVAAAAGAEFPHTALADGDKLAIGGVTLTAWATPGHTPNAMTFLLQVPGKAVGPAFALTGDTLFVGSIGRPDLLDVPPAQLAAQAWDSVQRLKTLPDGTLVLPAHGAGSLCGAHLSPATTSTIGAEKATNPFLLQASRSAFVAAVLSHQPVAPQYFRFNVELNRKGPPPVAPPETLPPAAPPAQVAEVIGKGGWIVDLRSPQAYAQGHLQGAINIALRGRLDTWTGIVVPFGAPLLLVGGDAEVREGAFRLQRIGYDAAQIVGRIGGGPDEWRAAQLPVRQTRLVTPKELAAAMQQGKEPLIVDVRTAEEFADLRLGDVGNVPVTEAERLGRSFERGQPLLLVCNSAYRSSLAVGLAERQGFTDLGSLDGGLDAWLAAGLPVSGRQAPGAVPAATASNGIVLPEPVDAALLARVLVDQPQDYALVDLRPAWQFAEWHLPAAVNVGLDRVAAHVAGLPATARVVLLDRDGTIAFAVAGALLQQAPQRPLRVLLGGLQDYWRQTRFAAPTTTSSPERGAPPPSPTTTPTPAAKKRNAGC